MNFQTSCCVFKRLLKAAVRKYLRLFVACLSSMVDFLSLVLAINPISSCFFLTSNGWPLITGVSARKLMQIPLCTFLIF